MWNAIILEMVIFVTKFEDTKLQTMMDDISTQIYKKWENDQMVLLWLSKHVQIIDVSKYGSWGKSTPENNYYMTTLEMTTVLFIHHLLVWEKMISLRFPDWKQHKRTISASHSN